MLVPDPLAAAAADYRREMGHAVPPEVLQMFALRPGPLIVEIRQAVALNRPVKAWLAQSHRANTPPGNWDFGVEPRAKAGRAAAADDVATAPLPIEPIVWP